MRKPKLSTILICIALFFTFVLMRFPYQNLRGWFFGKIYASTNILIVADEIYPALFGWPGIGVKNVDVTLPFAGKEIDLSTKSLVFRIGPAGLFPPVPFVSLNMKGLKKGGDLYVKASQAGGRVNVYFDAEEVSLDQIAPTDATSAPTGILSGEADLSLDDKDLSHSTGQVDLALEKFRVPAQVQFSSVIPGMTLGTVKAKINIKNGVAEISTFTFGSKDSDWQGAVTGDIKLGNDWLHSAVNLILRVKLSPSYLNNPQVAAAGLKGTFERCKTSKGDYAMKWTGTIEQLTKSITLIIPPCVID